MPTISFLSRDNTTIYDLAGSGLGFYGPGTFGTSVRVGDYQDNTYITDSTGAINGPLVNNVKYVHPNSGDLGSGNIHVLQDIPNYLATLNIRFTNTNPVKVQNAQVRIFDRTNINAPATGVTCKVAEIIHPWTTFTPTGSLGSGDTSWSSPGGSGGTYTGRLYDAPVSLVDSPGMSGLSPSGSSTTDTQHDWYILLSSSPDSIGSKTSFGLYTSVEFL